MLDCHGEIWEHGRRFFDDMATSNLDYDFSEIEKYWQKKWDEEKTFAAKSFDETKKSGKYYILDMYPYPSGAGLHIGHPEGYTASDILARYKWAKGFNVLHPMGWDAFGLPAEQYAVKTGTHPGITTAKNIDNFRRQIKSIGFAIDWDREINTTDPDYYKWTQWIFLKLFKMGLAYVDEKPVWWCPKLGTVLANEEVVDGKSEVGHHPVERRKLRQWVLKITAYADRLLAGLDKLDWPDSTKRLQANWIGRSEGAEVEFEIDGLEGEKLKIYTTRPDTLYGATYMVVAPEHPLLEKLTTPEMKESVESYKRSAAAKSDLDRTDLAKDKTGVFTGSYAVNPLNGARIPIWVADYVLMSYGTGAIMAVPAHDERDYDFAVKYSLPIIRVIDGLDSEGGKIPLPFIGSGKMVNSGEFDGTPSGEGKRKITEFLESKKIGSRAVNYKLRDWLFSRQRYWGEPFPIVWVGEAAYKAACDSGAFELPEIPVKYSGDGGETFYALPLSEKQLPLRLPEIETYQPTGTGESPLAHATDWLSVKVNAKTGEVVPASSNPSGEDWFDGRRETNTMPQWAGSCWYYLRYCDPRNSEAPISKENERYWGGPDFYIGGAEHAVLHLLYARFWHKVLFDCGVVSEDEPFKRLFHQGIILGALEYTAFKDGEKYVSADRPEGVEGCERVKVSEEEVEKVGSKFVLKSDKGVAVEARSFKMSKSRGNVVNPDDIVKTYGADSLRLYEMFLGPLEDQKPWNTKGIEGVSRFLKKFWREFIDREGGVSEKISASAEDSPEFARILNQSIKKVGEDIEGLRFNTAISQMMVLLSALQKEKSVSKQSAEKFVQILAPFAPHISEEIWNRLGHSGSVSKAPWPEADESKLASNTVKIAVQVNGKLRGEIEAQRGEAKESLLEKARNLPRVVAAMEGKNIIREICVPEKIINIVVK